jgi:hypothetical protein
MLCRPLGGYDRHDTKARTCALELSRNEDAARTLVEYRHLGVP